MRCGRREISKGKRGCAALLTVLLTFSRSTFFDPRRSSQRPRDCSWMARFQRPAIQANIGAETARLDEPLRTVVASLAERLERAEPEFVDVAAMCLDVITDLSRRYDAALEAKRAEGVFASWCLRMRAQRAVEYHLSHFVGLLRTPMAQPIIRRPMYQYGAVRYVGRKGARTGYDA